MTELRKEFKWCGYTWETCMKSERPIHPDNPNYYYSKDCVHLYNNNIILNLKYAPIIIEWWDKNWTNKTKYVSKIACGLIKSIETISVNNRIECDILAPTGPNLWFSFWMTACDDWPPEIDIFEGYTDENKSYEDKLKLHWKFPFLYKDIRMESNVHYKNNGIHKQVRPLGVHRKYLNLPLQNKYNNFRCDWREDSIEFYINNHLVRKITNKKVLSKMNTKGMWVIFNVFPNNKYDFNGIGDISRFGYSYVISNFKVTKL